jgi:hypothetical protein
MVPTQSTFTSLRTVMGAIRSLLAMFVASTFGLSCAFSPNRHALRQRRHYSKLWSALFSLFGSPPPLETSSNDRQRRARQDTLDRSASLTLAPMMEYTDRHFRCACNEEGNPICCTLVFVIRLVVASFSSCSAR